jgi:uncharacterized protein YegJ (DUF2314 family)
MEMRRLVVTAMLLLTLACSGKAADLNEIRVDDDGRVTFSGLDPEIMDAIDEARFKLAEFIRTVRNPKPNQRDFAVLVPYEGEFWTELLWVDSLTYDGLTFFGRIASQPDELPNLRLGSSVKVEPDIVIDWLYVEDGKVVGNFTGAVLTRRILEDDRVSTPP